MLSPALVPIRFLGYQLVAATGAVTHGIGPYLADLVAKLKHESLERWRGTSLTHKDSTATACPTSRSPTSAGPSSESR